MDNILNQANEAVRSVDRDQALKNIKEQAMYLSEFYHSLINKGMPEELAEGLVVNMHMGMMNIGMMSFFQAANTDHEEND